MIPFSIEQAEAGARIVTRCGYPVTIEECILNKKYPIRARVKTEDGIFTYSFTAEGKFISNEDESEYDLFIEEEEKEKPRREYSGTDSIYVPKDDEGIREELIDAINGLWDNDALPMPLSIKRKDAWLAWLKKQCEEKHADNKPKFQEGDWVISEQGRVQRITDVTENVTNHTCGYHTISYSFGILSYGYFSENVKNIRLWNITDAKDGDVLCAKGRDFKEYLFMFSSVNEENVIITHFCYVSHGCFYKMITRLGRKEDFMSVTPATKEQRDTLFQKIKESGYEWNPDTKELKKIDADTAEKKIKTRKMTYKELSWWLREHPEEHREWKFKTRSEVYTSRGYSEEKEHNPVAGDILIRKNGGDWMEPLIEE